MRWVLLNCNYLSFPSCRNGGKGRANHGYCTHSKLKDLYQPFPKLSRNCKALSKSQQQSVASRHSAIHLDIQLCVSYDPLQLQVSHNSCIWLDYNTHNIPKICSCCYNFHDLSKPEFNNLFLQVQQENLSKFKFLQEKFRSKKLD